MVSKLINETSDAKCVRLDGGGGGGDAVEGLQTCRRDGAGARCRDSIRRQIDGGSGRLRGDGDGWDAAEGVVEGDRRVDELDVLGKVRGHRVRHGDDALGAGVLVLEDVELCVEDVVRLADGEVEGEPVTRWRDGRGRDIVLLEESVHRVQRLLRWCNEGLDLGKGKQVRWCAYMMVRAYLVLGQVLAKPCISWRADGHERILETGGVELLERKAHA